jgi:cell division septum initiation protein DivIVA
MGLRYAEFVVPLVKAVQELSNENETLREKNNELETRIKKIEEMLATNANTITSNATQNSITQSSVAHLDQNVPNPSNGNTTIRYSIPSSVKQASLIITNMQGQVIKSYSLNNSAGQLTIATAQLSPGNYFYSLITDGKKADSKQMTIGR